MRSRAALLLFFFGALHLLVLVNLWRQSGARIAEGVVLVSVVPLFLSAAYLLQRVSRSLSWLDLCVLAFAAWSVVSAVLYLQPGNPTHGAAYAYGLYHFVLPIACYFAVKSVPVAQHTKLLSGFVLLNAFVAAYGLYMHFARPDYYVQFLTRALTQSGATEEWQYFARLQSYLGSTSVGYLGALSIVLATLATAKVRRLLPLLALLFVAASALSLQRASLVALALALVYLILLFHEQTALRLGVAVTLISGVVYGTARLERTGDPLKDTIQTRATTDITEGLESFMSDRGYGRGLRYLSAFPLGLGVGATSSAATNVGLVGLGEVADANFMRIAADLGVLGLAMFLLIIAAASAKAWRSQRRAAWLTILVIHCGIMLSTNVFDSFYISHSFWALVAILDCDREPLAAEGARFPAALSIGSLKPAVG